MFIDYKNNDEDHLRTLLIGCGSLEVALSISCSFHVPEMNYLYKKTYGELDVSMNKALPNDFTS